MCCFSRPVESVSGTQIFARHSRANLQFLVYQMNFKAAEDLSMILPIPVPKQTSEKAVRFISLEEYPNFFDDMQSGFPRSVPRASVGAAGGAFGGATLSKLDVVKVGSFEASFVPTIGDFSRLDERFRLPNGTWEKLPQYASFGFAVFKLKKGDHRTHPMAFEFPRSNARRLFFPTVHIHDGLVHDKADFDHALYAQFEPPHAFGVAGWTESVRPAGMFLNADKCQGLINTSSHAFKRIIKGNWKNEDIVV